jgi:hypothetical protein
MAYAKQILTGQDGSASFTSAWIPVAVNGFRAASFTLAWAGATSTAGTLSFEGTDDPAQGVVVPLTINTSHGTFPTVGAAASQALVVINNCPAYVRMKWTRSGGGAAGQFNGYVTLT